MLSVNPIPAIAPELDSQAIAQTELEQQANQVAPNAVPIVFTAIQPGLRDVARATLHDVERAMQAIVEHSLELGQALLRMKANLKRSEYKIFLEQLGLSSIKANKQIKLAKTFDGFATSQLVRIDLSTLFSLCSKTYANVVEQLRSMQEVSQEVVERMMKESRSPRKPKQSENPVTGWKPNRSGGGRHYQVALHGDLGEKVGMEIERRAEAQNVLPQRVIEEAFLSTTIQPSEYTLAQMEEFRQNIDEMRDLSIQKQRLEIKVEQQAKKITELETILRSKPKVETQNSELSRALLEAKNWEEIAEAVKRDSAILLDAVKGWSSAQRQELSKLLARFVDTVTQGLQYADWVPDVGNSLATYR